MTTAIRPVPEKGDSMGIMSIVHMRLSNEEEALALLHETLAATRAFPGCLRADVVQDLDDPGHIVLVETWEAPDDETAYRRWRAEEPPNPAFREFVAAAPEIQSFTVRGDV
jgi:heme oxygenase (mycobilin-producing)